LLTIQLAERLLAHSDNWRGYLSAGILLLPLCQPDAESKPRQIAPTSAYSKV
jgi:hypothetical protein